MRRRASFIPCRHASGIVCVVFSTSRCDEFLAVRKSEWRRAGTALGLSDLSAQRIPRKWGGYARRTANGVRRRKRITYRNRAASNAAPRAEQGTECRAMVSQFGSLLFCTALVQLHPVRIDVNRQFEKELRRSTHRRALGVKHEAQLGAGPYLLYVLAVNKVVDSKHPGCRSRDFRMCSILPFQYSIACRTFHSGCIFSS